MSFILDALKKSETDRQRQNGPALFEVRVAPPRSGLPLWAMGLAGLLAVNLLIGGWVLWAAPAGAGARHWRAAARRTDCGRWVGRFVPWRGPRTGHVGVSGRGAG